ncbi:MAG: pyridoxamine 5'-phosphate oxidase, partial [Halioglobus sp.]|nr:pyridoxamine 5'-phosphate oxidase [Halioglobus sp.]
RREYTAGGLTRQMLDVCPLRQFEVWLEQAVRAGVQDPTAMVLATVEDSGAPWQRIVLCKGLSDGGFAFYTNLDSDKACAIAQRPEVSLLFPWNVLDRQVSIGGSARRMSAAESRRYFMTRPRESQLAAWASRQSRPLESRSSLQKKALEMRHRFGEGEVPMPAFWGGFRVVPQRIEFWQGGEHRLHDRFVYRLDESGGWQIERLQP